MMRGKPKTPENLARNYVKKSLYHSKKYPVFHGKRLRGNISYEGRKKLYIELVKSSIRDKTIVGIFLHDVPREVPFTKTTRKISAYALHKFGTQNRSRAVTYLLEIRQNVLMQHKAVQKFIRELSSRKRHLTLKEQNLMEGKTDHISMTNFNLLQDVFYEAAYLIDPRKVEEMTPLDEQA